jgi:hypothetical protein
MEKVIRLSEYNFDLACQFIEEKARPIDKALFRYHFHSGVADAVLAELACYQNPDGGFGHGLEADFRMAASSPMATSVGLQYATAVNAPLEHPIIVRAIRYLVSTYDPVENYWPATFLDVNDEPHAPWWSPKEVCAPSEDDWPNPSAELAGYVYCYAGSIPLDFRAKVEKRVFQSLERGGGMTSAMKYYNILCWQRALPYFSSDIREQIITSTHTAIPWISLVAEELMEVNICWLAPTPYSLIAQVLPHEVNELLDREITRQSVDGGWWPTWEWGQYPDVWTSARQDWAGKITLEILLALRAHGRC